VVATDRIALLHAGEAPVVHEFDVGGEVVVAAAVAPPTNLLAAAYYSGTIQLWSMGSGESLDRKVRAHKRVIRDLQFNADGTRLVSAAADSNAFVWKTESGRIESSPLPLPHSSALIKAAFSPDGDRIVTASDDRKVRLWDARIGGLLGESMEHAAKVRVVRFSPDGRQVVSASGSGDGAVRLWDGSDATPLSASAHFPKGIADVSFRPDLHRNRYDLLVVVGSQEAHVVSPTPLRWLERFEPELAPPEPATLAAAFARAHIADIKSCDLSPNGIYVATVSSNATTARVWNRKSTTPPHRALACVSRQLGPVQPGRSAPGHMHYGKQVSCVGCGHRHPTDGRNPLR
jgi:WD40 repeat protein